MYFNFNKDQLINAILENNLPLTLTSKLKPHSDKIDDATKKRSVFDGDQFDFSNKDKIDYSKIHIGKK